MKIIADGVDITPIVGGLTWKNTIAELATTMAFEVAKLNAQYTKSYLPRPNGIVTMQTNAEVFRGVVLNVDDSNPNFNKYTLADFGWYLNKDKVVYQFDKMPVPKALAEMCGDHNIALDSVCDIPVEITAIYNDKTISEIIKDILEQATAWTGYAYNFDMTPQGLRVYRLGDMHAYPEFKQSSNTRNIYSPIVRGDVAHSLDIDGTEKASCTIIEAVDSYTRAGYEIKIDDVKYIIQSSDHSIKKGIHYNKLDLKRVG